MSTVTVSSRYQDGTYAQDVPTWHIEHSAWKAHQVRQMLDKNKVEPTTICEVGCGAGEILRVLHDHMPIATFVGFEVSPQALKMCSSRATDRLQFEMRDVYADPPTERFALALVLDVLEHVEDVYGFVRSIRRVGQKAVFHIPLDLSVQSVLRPRRLLVAREEVGHIHYFTTETALALLNDCGYTITDWTYTRTSLETELKSHKARLAKFGRAPLYRLSPSLAARTLGGFSLIALAE